MIGMIVGGLTKAVGGYFENKSQESQAKANSIKDEISLVVLLLPALLVFFEPFQDDVKRGFEILGTLPEYYQHLLYIAIAGSFGIKGVNHFIKRK